jgi:hypothetical protein
MCICYERLLITMHHPPSHYTDVTTAPLLLATQRSVLKITNSFSVYLSRALLEPGSVLVEDG